MFARVINEGFRVLGLGVLEAAEELGCLSNPKPLSLASVSVPCCFADGASNLVQL